MRSTILAVAGVAGVALSIAGCRIEKTPASDPNQTATSVFINDGSFDPAAMVEADWNGKILPFIQSKAGPYDIVAEAVKASPDEAGARYGFRENQTGVPWTYAVTVDGTVTAANTESRAATLDVKTGGGKTVTLQLGPVVRGTSIRDILSLHPFGSFKNQVDYAQYGKALNAKANATALASAPRQDLVGRHVTALGVFSAASGDAPPLVTPVRLTVGPKP
jgi:predicted lipoprotein